MMLRCNAMQSQIRSKQVSGAAFCRRRLSAAI
jgi:hypothetical protein